MLFSDQQQVKVRNSTGPTLTNGSAITKGTNAPNSPTGRHEKSMEQILAEALQLTDDEKACLLASQKESLVQKMNQLREQDRINGSALVLTFNGNGAIGHDGNKPTIINGTPIQPYQNGFVDSNGTVQASSTGQQQQPVQNGSATQPNQRKNSNTRSPVKPFLSKGSVAERVLLFEKCPELRSQHRNVGKALYCIWKQPSPDRTQNDVANIARNFDVGVAGKPSLSRLTYQQQQQLASVSDQHHHQPVSGTQPQLQQPCQSTTTTTLSPKTSPNQQPQSQHQHHSKNGPSAVASSQCQSSGIASNGSIATGGSFGRFERRKSSFGRRGSWTGSSCNEIPRFYFPFGRPYTSLEIETQVRRIRNEFDKLPGRQATRQEMARIVKACGVPTYWKLPLFLAATGGTGTLTKQPSLSNKSNGITTTIGQNNLKNFGGSKCVLACDDFIDYWKRLLSTSYDDASRFVKILTRGQRNYLVPDDFVPMIQDVVETHPGLGFLKECIEFHSRYVSTVISRIYYCVNKSWSGRISIPELRKSNFLAVLAVLDDEEDINQIFDYFSYEHFYVIYCKFWELDKDHDLIIDKYDLSRHNDGAISSRMIDRIFSGAVTRGPVRKHGKMTYNEFVWFLISEEDKRQPRSIEYWFRCMDLDGDGYLSMYELEFFYEEQVRRMEALGIEALPFTDCICQMLDMVRPTVSDKISLADLKRCRMTSIFFDTFFNLDKYLDHEQRDPFVASKSDEDSMQMSDWERYAAEEYEILVSEESTSTQPSNGTSEIICLEREPHVVVGSPKSSTSSLTNGASGFELNGSPIQTNV